LIPCTLRRKAVQGIEEVPSYYAKGSLLTEKRVELGELSRPAAVFMYSLKWEANIQNWRIVTRWVPIEGARSSKATNKKPKK